MEFVLWTQEQLGSSEIIIMKVKIGDKIYDSSQEPIMIILEEYNKTHISNMDPRCTKYCEAPNTYTPEQLEEFMK